VASLESVQVQTMLLSAAHLRRHAPLAPGRYFLEWRLFGVQVFLLPAVKHQVA
jgi:hypothetical protein